MMMHSLFLSLLRLHGLSNAVSHVSQSYRKKAETLLPPSTLSLTLQEHLLLVQPTSFFFLVGGFFFFASIFVAFCSFTFHSSSSFSKVQHTTPLYCTVHVKILLSLNSSSSSSSSYFSEEINALSGVERCAVI